jgi:hypothetical protein
MDFRKFEMIRTIFWSIVRSRGGNFLHNLLTRHDIRGLGFSIKFGSQTGHS